MTAKNARARRYLQRVANQHLRSWLGPQARSDERCFEALRVALLIAMGGWKARHPEDVEVAALVVIDEAVSDGLVELRDDGRYHMSSGTAVRRDTGPVNVIDATTGELMAQGWLEGDATTSAPCDDVLRPFIASRPSELSDLRMT